VRDSGAPQVQGKSTLHGQYAQASIPTYFNIKKLDKVIAKIKKVQFCWLVQLSTRTND